MMRIGIEINRIGVGKNCMASVTVENYVKQIYLDLQSTRHELVPMGRLAAAMGVVPGTVTTMVKSLADAGLVEYEPRGGAKLTQAGEHLALHVLRRHRLVELLLVKVLKLDWSEVHAEAEELEHAISEKVLDAIDALLGRPTVDPHGDPIPTAKGQVDSARHPSLADCPVGAGLRIARVTDQAAAFLQFAERCGLIPGVGIRVESRDHAADAIVVRLSEREPLTLGSAAAAKILVRDQAS